MDLLSRNGVLVVGKQGGLDRYRLIAAFLVIAIHTSPLLSVNENADFFLTRIFARMAVPLFLMITGRYVAAKFWENDPDEKGSSAAVLLSFLKKLRFCMVFLSYCIFRWECMQVTTNKSL